MKQLNLVDSINHYHETAICGVNTEMLIWLQNPRLSDSESAIAESY